MAEKASVPVMKNSTETKVLTEREKFMETELEKPLSLIRPQAQDKSFEMCKCLDCLILEYDFSACRTYTSEPFTKHSFSMTLGPG